MPSRAAIDTSERIYSGVLLTSLAYVFFSSQDAAIKLLVVGLSVWQIMFFRSVTVLAGAALGAACDARNAEPVDRQGRRS